MRIAFACVLAGFILLACHSGDSHGEHRKDGFSETAKTKEDSLFKEVMEGHDIGMARMGKISKYLNQVKQQLDSLGRLPANKINKDYQQALIDLQEDLNYADYSMNTWMEEFNIDSSKENMDQRIKYLEAEKVKVGQVKESILVSLSRADSLFGKR